LKDTVSSVTAVNDETVSFKFTQPYPSFEGDAGVLAIFPASAMASPNSYFADPTVTSGQYTITGGWSSNRLQLQENPDYWGGLPAVKNVTLTVIADGNSAISQLQSGQVNFAGDLPPNFVTQVQGTPGLQVLITPVYGFFDLRLQNTHGVFADIRVRKAVNEAINRDAIVSAIWGSNNVAQSGFWPKGMEGYNPSSSVAVNLNAARNDLKGTACASGCTVTMIYSNSDFAFSGQLALMVQSQLAQIGIRVQLDQMDAATEINDLFAGNYNIAPGAMPSDGNTPDGLLNRALLGTGSLKAEFTGFNSPTMNALITKATSTNGTARAGYLTQIENLFAQDQPYVILAPWVRESVTTLPSGVFALVGPYASMESVK
jgi:peptide/nickel transport system substrate-binding protein